MRNRVVGVLMLAVCSWAIVPSISWMAQAVAQTAAGGAKLKISGAVTTPLDLTVADLKKMPRKTLTVVNPHDKKTEVYEGVAFEELLRRAGQTGASIRDVRGRSIAWCHAS
jgi:DMSO/TMAO reductase YedYZ molybdopterin-dependent catalytic subunit